MKFILTFLTLTTVLLSNQSYAQQTDSLKQAKTRYLSKELTVPEDKALQIATILDEYKVAANKAVNDKKLSQDQLRSKLNLLIAEKNAKLEKILTRQQLQKLIPTTEKP